MQPFRRLGQMMGRGLRSGMAALLVALLLLMAGCTVLPKKNDPADPKAIDSTGEPLDTGDRPEPTAPRDTDTPGGSKEVYRGEYPWMGAWLESWPTDETPLIDAYERKVGAKLDLTDVFVDWYTPVRNVTHTLTHVSERGTMPILTWEPHGLTTVEIADGQRQITLRNGRTMSIAKYIDDFANGVCRIVNQTGVPVFIRPMHEMNGNWYTWGISYQAADGTFPNTNEAYKLAWARIYYSFESRCGDLVHFVWAVNHFSVGGGATILGTYPGDDQVDYVGIDGYNWGSHGWGWQDFDMLFVEALCVVHEQTPKPILLSEIGTSEGGGNKAEWIKEMYTRILETPRIKGFVWLDHAKFEVETNGPMDWQTDSSPESLAAYTQGARHLMALRDGTAENEIEPWPPC